MIKKLVIVGMGMGIGPLVQLISMPWLSRIYSPTEFGYFALFVSTVSILSTISCFRYEVAIPVVEDSLLKATTTVALISALATMLLVTFFLLSGGLQHLYPFLNEFGLQIWWIPIAASCSGTMLLVYYLTLRRGEFILNATMRSLQPIIFLLLALFFSRYGLLSAQIVSWLLVVFVGLFYLARDILPFQKKLLWKTAIRFRRYPILLMPTSLLDILALMLPIFLINSAYGSEVVGNFSQLQRLVGSPLLLLSVAMGQVFFIDSGHMFRSKKSSEALMWKTLYTLSGCGILLMMILAIKGEVICRLMLGDGWRIDTLFILLVSTPIIIRAVVSPISTIFLTHHRTDIGVKWQIGYFITTSLVLYFSSHLLKLEGFLMVYGIHELIMYSLYFGLAKHVASVHFRKA